MNKCTILLNQNGKRLIDHIARGTYKGTITFIRFDLSKDLGALLDFSASVEMTSYICFICPKIWLVSLREESGCDRRGDEGIPNAFGTISSIVLGLWL